MLINIKIIRISLQNNIAYFGGDEEGSREHIGVTL